MDILLSVIAFLLSVLGIIGCIVPVLPGPALSFIGFLCAYGCSYSTISTPALLGWVAAVIAVSVADYFLPAWVTKRMGGSRAGQIGATLGMIGGLFFFFSVIGLILAPFFGAVLGELIHDKSDSGRAFRIGLGSFISFALGTGIKLVVTFAMLIRVISDTYPVLKEAIFSIFQ